MNALNVIGTAVNLAFFVLVLAGTLAILDEEGKTRYIGHEYLRKHKD